MHYAFDLNGTIDKFPVAFSQLMMSLHRNGHHVTVLTGAIFGSVDAGQQKREAEAAGSGVVKGVHYTDLVIALGATVQDVAESKAAYCKASDVVMLWEDTDFYAQAVANKNPNMASYLLVKGA